MINNNIYQKRLIRIFLSLQSTFLTNNLFAFTFNLWICHNRNFLLYIQNKFYTTSLGINTFSLFKQDNPIHNLNLAFDVAEKYLNIPRMLDAEGKYVC